MRLKTLSLPQFSSLLPWLILIHLGKMTTWKIQLVSAGIFALKTNADISYVQLFLVSLRTQGCFGAASSFFYAHCLSLHCSLPNSWEEKEKSTFQGKRNFLPPKIELDKACPGKYLHPHLTSRQAVSFPSTTSFAASQSTLRSYPIPLCRVAGILLPSQSLETLGFRQFYCSLLESFISSYHISDFSSLWLTTLSYDRLEFLYKYFLFLRRKQHTVA